MRSLLILIIISILMNTASATTTVKGVDSGDTLFWIVLTVILTLVFAMRGSVKLLMHPLYLGVVILLLIVLYIIYSAVMLAYGVSDAINGQIQALSEVIS